MKSNDCATRWQRPVSVLLASQTISAFGTALAQFAITWYLTLETKSGVVMALSIVFGMVPQAVISPLGGVLADRVSRRRLIVASQATIAVATIGLALAMYAGHRDHWLIFLALMVRSIGAGVRAPAVSAVVPQMVPAIHLLRVNGTFQTAQSAISILSPIAAAAALAGTSITVVLLIDVAMSLIAIALMLATPLPPPMVGDDRARWLGDLVEGLRYARGHRFVRWVFTMAVVVILLGAAPAYLVPLRITRAFRGEVWMLGGSQIAVSLGMIAVGALAAVLGQRLNLTTLLVAAPMMFGASSLVLGLTRDIWVLFAAMVLAGGALTITMGLSGTLLQERVQPAYLGRIFGLFGVVQFAMPLGLVVFGPLADVLPVENLFVGSGIASFVVAAFVLLRPSGRAAVREGLLPPVLHPAAAEIHS